MTPAAILLGSVIVAAGLYFGLQRPAHPPAPTPSRAEASPAVVEASPAVAEASPAVAEASPAAAEVEVMAPPPRRAAADPSPSLPSERYGRVAEDAARALEARRSDFVKSCWAPSLKKRPAPARAKYIFSMSFDESGKEVARGISEVRGMERSDVAQCLRMIPLGINVPPPGMRAAVEVEVILP
ncbi:hypothetical protein SOCE26_046170 [Sorangium cellulosum]|uniref:Uncharacterized protein n=2 Tax=Sorangium cellulosum TaxID=56 RepID=A0A2L0EV47_SORCE|nr:hypothetical protein SOCE26_046170 [Sorangium cellulosum]